MITAKEFYKYLYGEDAPKNFTESSSIHIFRFAEGYAEHLKQVKNITYEPVLPTVFKTDTVVFFEMDEDCKFYDINGTEVTTEELMKHSHFIQDQKGYMILNDGNIAVVCNWKLVDNGMMGCHDYEYKTTCGRTLDKDTTTNANYCPYCGGKRIN